MSKILEMEQTISNVKSINFTGLELESVHLILPILKQGIQGLKIGVSDRPPGIPDSRNYQFSRKSIFHRTDYQLLE